MYTQCPNCETYFQISAEHLKVAQGNVRCGQCQHVFSALGNLSEEPPPRATPPRPVPRAKKTEVAPKTRPTPNNGKTPASVAAPQNSAPKTDSRPPTTKASTPPPPRQPPSPSPGNKATAKNTAVASNNDAITNIRRLNEASTKLQSLAEGQANYVEKLKQQQEELSRFLSQTKAKTIPPLNIPTPQTDQAAKDQQETENNTAEESIDLNQAFKAIDDLQDSLKETPEQTPRKKQSGNKPKNSNKDSKPVKDVLAIDALDGIEEQLQQIDDDDTGVEDFLPPNKDADSIVHVRGKKRWGKDSKTKAPKDKDRAQQAQKPKAAKAEKPKPPARSKSGNDSPANMSAPPPTTRRQNKDSLIIQAKANAADTEMIVPKQLLEDHIDEQISLMHYRSNLVWSTGCLIMMLFFLGQTVYFKHDELAQVDGMRSWVISFCDKFNCVVDPKTDIAKLELVGQDIRTHAKNKSALSINATIINNARFDQPFPALEISFSDLNGQPVAKRRFLPGEYMPEYDPGISMQPNTPVQVHLDILDPGSAAVNFEFGFLEL